MNASELEAATTHVESIRAVMTKSAERNVAADIRLSDALDRVADVLSVYGLDQVAERDRLRAENREALWRGGRGQAAGGE